VTVHELGHIVLYVKDLERSARFYGEVLGWRQVKAPEGMPAALFSSGRTHHELLLIEVGPQARPVPQGHRLGLYHFGLKVGTTDEELAAMSERLKAEGVRVVGATDHGVTHSLYILDPDGNEIELYIDVQPETWRTDPEAVFASPRPLGLRPLKAGPAGRKR